MSGSGDVYCVGSERFNQSPLSLGLGEGEIYLKGEKVMAFRDEEVEIYVEIVWETENAYKCSDGINQFWLPKSQIMCKEEVKGGHKITIPHWLAEEKGVI